ncbi:MAG: acyl carrier protein [Bacteroidota bacterium]|nr:acyl carrier protein [Bacteroidota bacterium]
MRDKVHSFIQTNYIFDEKRTVGDDEQLLASGIIDSTGILELISFLEKEFSIIFDDQELVGENFNSIASIIAILQRKISKN